jgi:hypothetical protein
MSRLEDVPGKDFFTVPDGYFDQLPAKIQGRIERSKLHYTLRPLLRPALIYALPLLIVAVVLFLTTRPRPDAEAMLASVKTADLIHYLQESKITTEEMLEAIDFSVDDLEALENQAYDLSLPEVDAETIDSQFNSLLP